MSERDTYILTAWPSSAPWAPTGSWPCRRSARSCREARQGHRRGAAAARPGQAGEGPVRAGTSSQFPRMYASLGRLGKAVPPDEDVPSLLVQLNHAAAQANVDFQLRRAEAGPRREAGRPPRPPPQRRPRPPAPPAARRGAGSGAATGAGRRRDREGAAPAAAAPPPAALPAAALRIQVQGRLLPPRGPDPQRHAPRRGAQQGARDLRPADHDPGLRDEAEQDHDPRDHATCFPPTRDCSRARPRRARPAPIRPRRRPPRRAPRPRLLRPRR